MDGKETPWMEHMTLEMLTDYAVQGDRPGWDSYLMQLAKVAALRASCPRLSVGAVIADQSHRVISTGYNGAPRGRENCLDAGCNMQWSPITGRDHCFRSEHAEMNALMTADERGIDVTGCTVYSTHRPCRECEVALREFGIAKVWYLEEYA